MFLVAANTRQAIVGQKEWITTGSSGIQVQFLFSSDWDGLSKFAVFRNAEIEESVIPIALPASGLTELPAENCDAEYVDEKVYVGVYGTDGLGHIIIPTIWVSLGVLKEGAAYEGMDPPQPTPDMWAQILAIAQNAGAENAAAAEQSAEEAEASKEAIQDMNVQAETLPDESPLTVTKEVDPETGAVTLIFGLTRGPKGNKGDDGDSPTITITPIQGGHRFTVTDKDHPTGQSFDVMNGAPGAPGSPGAPGAPGDPGYSPEVTITTITGGHRVTITDEEHPTGQSFDVMDGASDAGQVSYDQTQTYQSGTVGKELSDQKNAISEGNLNQHIKVNPFVIGSGFVTLPIGTLRKNRSNAEILENGGAKFTRNEDSPTSHTFGCFVRIRANDGQSNAGHKIYIRLADVDVSNITNYDRMVISGSNGTDGSQAGIASTNMTLVSGVAEIIVTPDSDFEMLNIYAHSTTPASEGEYFTIGSAQYIDLTDMFGAGYEPSLEIFKFVYESGMPYPFIIPTITSDLKEVVALIDGASDCDIVQTNADIASTTKDYVLVMDNDSKFAQGGPLLYKKMAVASAGYLRDDGSRVCAVPDQGVLVASNPPKDLLLGIIKSYIDNPALSYENNVDLFSETPNGKINCSAFVSAVLQGISYNSSKYVLSDNLSMDKVINAGFSKTNQLIKLSSFNMAEYFAENKRLFSLKCLENGYESRRKLQFGDILFFTGTEYPDRYYGIGHVAIVIDASWDYCTIAHVTSQAAGGIVQQNFGTETGCCTLLRLTATQADNTFNVFARPDYNEPKLLTAIQVLKSCLDGNYEINLGHDYTPGYSLNQTTMLPSMSVSYGISGYYDAIGGATVKYIGAATDASGNGYVCLLAQYDENYAPIIRSGITTNPVVLNSATRYIRLQFGYTLSSGVIPTLHTGDDCTVVMYMHPGNVYDDITDLSNAISQLQPAATQSDVGKALIVKTVDAQTGKPTGYEYGEAGGGQTDIGLSVVNGQICVSYSV